jgi:sugar lactone lactonase YvrE
MPEIMTRDIYFGEAPRWHDGRLWFSDFYGHCVHALTPDGADDVVLRIDGQPSGLGWLPDGTLLVVSMLDHRVLRQAADGTVSGYADVSAFARVRSNDMLVDAAGRAWVGNFGFDTGAPDREARRPAPTSLTAISPEGAVTEAATGLMFPNGMVLTPDGATLIVAETYAARLTAFAVASDGTLSGRRTWADLSAAGVYPDGICLDADGAVWVANAAQSACLRVREGGEIAAAEQFSQRCFACALGGPDQRTLYAMTAPTSDAAIAPQAPLGLVEAVRVDVPGAGRP